MFTVLATLLALLASALLLLGLRRPARSAPSRAALNLAALQVLQDDLARDRDLQRLTPAQYDAALEELQRRVLEDVSAAAPQAAPAFTARTARAAIIAAALALPMAAAALYAVVGTPAWRAPPALAGVQGRALSVAQLEAHVVAAPQDARGWVLLARLRLELDRFDGAAQAYARALEISPKVARDPQVWCEYADALALARGSLLGEPQRLIERALALDPAHPRALEMAGSAAVEARDWTAARRHWSQLLGLLEADSLEHAQLAAAISALERRAGAGAPAS